MKLQLSASNALNKYLKADLPHLSHEPGKQAGVNTLISDNNSFNWQLQIIDNSYKSREKTIIVCEANSRFTFFIPVSLKLSQKELTQRLQYEWQLIMAETLEVYQLIPRSDIAVLLSELSKIEFMPHWVKNTDLSISGHISDAALWVTQTLQEEGLYDLPKDLAIELAIYLNTQPKRITNKTTGRKEKFIPIERLLHYCQSLIAARQLDDSSSNEILDTSNIINFSDYHKK
ncbi:amino acid adenylation [Pseudoalteromonas sp. Angola-4]|uniref:amino acid adenylation n=1 Tax=Pseudoalteromonas sp. Angola-4 TaxID=3025335 RepID=UPI002359A750|nr:amino acid adenylation [Pseudoalteromonas sp. Angola-4]MDC9511398.1 amino acid adenylation [Pseudoalteromonas sp. Angola-4]